VDRALILFSAVSCKLHLGLYAMQLSTNNPEGVILCGAPRGAAAGILRGAPVNCMREILILNEIWVQGKIYILVSTLLGWNILLTKYRLRTISSTFCRRLRLEKYVIHRLNFVRCTYLNSFRVEGGATFMKLFKGGFNL
jgi:hypothetical protein